MNWEEITFLQKNWIKKAALITANLFTLGNISSAVIGIILIFLQAENYIFWFGKLLAICAILDFTDGKLARIGGSKKLAVDIDTLMDSISFGLFPAIFIGFQVALWNNSITTWSIILGVFTGLVYLGAAWFRLLRFVNRDPLYTPYFQGLPSSFASLVIACLVVFEENPEDTLAWVILVATVIISGFMISKTPFPSFKGVPGKFDLYWIITTTILVCAFTVLPYGYMKFAAYGIAVYMIVYLMFGPEYAIKLEKMQEKQKIEKKVS